MKAEGKIEVDVNIDRHEAIKLLLEEFFKTEKISFNDYCIKREEGVRGIYKLNDRYYAGMPDFDYQMIREGENAIKLFYLLRSIETLWDDMEKEEKILSLKKQ